MLVFLSLYAYCMTIITLYWHTGKTVFTSDHALKLEWIPDWLAIVGSGYIGLEFSDVYTALGSEVCISYMIIFHQKVLLKLYNNVAGYVC